MARKQKKYHYIYRTTCLVTDKFYIGMHSTDNLNDGYLGSGKILGYSRRKHGDENHKLEILEMCGSREQLRQREREVVNEALLADPLNMNLKYGGEGGGRFWNEQHRLKAQCAGGKKGGKATGKINLAKVMANPSTEQKRTATFVERYGVRSPTVGTKWVVKNNESKLIKKHQLDEYIGLGFKPGRK